MLEYILFAIGFALLIKGADFLVDGSSSLAKKFGVPSLVIGLTIVAFGTSMPEFIVNMVSAFSGQADVALGNIIGSNIFNLLFILGIASFLMPLKVKDSTVWKEIPMSFLAALVLFVFANDSFFDGGENIITRADGIILLLFFSIFLYYVLEMTKGEKQKEERKDTTPISKIILLIAGGLIMLFFGGKWVVDGAVLIARQIGIAEYIISATIVAAGTSLPELVTSVVAAIRKEYDISVGNIVGSNIFNIFWILGVTALITPLEIQAYVSLDILVLLLATILFFAFMFIGRKHELERWQGGVFLLVYAAYVAHLLGAF